MKKLILWIGFYTLLKKEIMRFLRIWSQTLLPPVITMSLYFTIFGHLVGAQIKPIHGYRYIQYITPGLIMMSVVTNAYSNVTASFFGMRFQRSIDELLVSPMPNYLILLGFTAGGVVRGLIVALLVTFLASLFTDFQVQHIFIVFITALLSATLFSLAGFLNALFAKKFDDIAIVPTFVLTPLTYLGGVFYSISMLPPFWQKVSLLNPILYMVNAFRFGMFGITDIPILHALVIMLGCVGLLFWLNCFLLNKGVGVRA